MGVGSTDGALHPSSSSGATTVSHGYSHPRLFLFLVFRESLFSILLASASSHFCHVGIQASTATRHLGFDKSSLAAAPFSRCSSRNRMRCLVTISTLRRTECHEYGWPWSRVNSAVTVIHHLQRLLRCPKSGAWRLHISNRDTSSEVVKRLPCLRSLLSPLLPAVMSWLAVLMSASSIGLSRSSFAIANPPPPTPPLRLLRRPLVFPSSLGDGA